MVQNKNFSRTLIAIIVVLAFLGMGYGVKAVRHSEAASSTAVVKDSGVAMVPANFSDLAEKVRPGVVNIKVTKTVENLGYGVCNFGWPFGDKNPFGDFFGPFSGENQPHRFQQDG